METQSLWPELAVEAIKGPVTILKEQAGYLAQKTKNVLIPDVGAIATKSQEIFVYSFFIEAPALKNYRYKLFDISHRILYYPVSIRWEGWGDDWLESEDENGFVQDLREIFNAPETVKIISSLYSQSIAVSA
jgi:hypothetical protein